MLESEAFASGISNMQRIPYPRFIRLIFLRLCIKSRQEPSNKKVNSSMPRENASRESSTYHRTKDQGTSSLSVMMQFTTGTNSRGIGVWAREILQWILP